MPTYDYECDACHHKMEVVQRMSEDRLVQCPACGQNTLRRLISAPMIIDRAPRTVGAIADQNAARMEREGTLPAQVRRRKDPVTPWWRKGKKINRDVLKDPKKYIATGRTE